MDWHIITSSKGGVGKTLISLMLSAYHCIEGHVLIIDLNGMNADLCRLVTAEHLEDYFLLNLGNKVGKFYFERVGGLNYGLNYINGWQNDAFKTFTPDTFIELFLQLNGQVKDEIQKRWGYPINTVIIDTNYHFCNIFPAAEKDYEQQPFSQFLQSEHLFIWFIWVYRQLTNLIEVKDDPNNPLHVVARTVQERAFTIESKIKNAKLGNPFVHVFSPLSVGQVVLDKSFLKNFSRMIKSKNDDISTIEPLQKLMDFIEKGKISENAKFNQFVNHLRMARLKVIKENEEIEDVNEFFLKVLGTYVSRLGSCPRNIVPIHIYQKKLLGYTEANYEGLLDKIYDLEIYRDSFEKAYRALVKQT